MEYVWLVWDLRPQTRFFIVSIRIFIGYKSDHGSLFLINAGSAISTTMSEAIWADIKWPCCYVQLPKCHYKKCMTLFCHYHIPYYVLIIILEWKASYMKTYKNTMGQWCFIPCASAPIVEPVGLVCDSMMVVAQMMANCHPEVCLILAERSTATGRVTFKSSGPG